jgi:DNA topoisomerase IA
VGADPLWCSGTQSVLLIYGGVALIQYTRTQVSYISIRLFDRIQQYFQQLYCSIVSNLQINMKESHKKDNIDFI